MKETNPRLRRLTSAVACLPFLSMVGTLVGIQATFEAGASGTSVTDAARVDLWLGYLAGLVGMLTGLVAALVYRPWRP